MKAELICIIMLAALPIAPAATGFEVAGIEVAEDDCPVENEIHDPPGIICNVLGGGGSPHDCSPEDGVSVGAIAGPSGDLTLAGATGCAPISGEVDFVDHESGVSLACTTHYGQGCTVSTVTASTCASVTAHVIGLSGTDSDQAFWCQPDA